MNYKCNCGGSLIPVKIGIEKDGIYQGTVCYKQWCPHCTNSRLDDYGNVLYYQLRGSNEFTMDPMDFWAPENIEYKYKAKFISAVLKLANQNRFKGKQTYTMQQIRDAYRSENGNQGHRE